MRKINLISDTVTRPTNEMLTYMMSAKVGDDVYGEDPTVNRLHQKMAKMFGKEAALFMPSGTMSNQIAINVLTKPGNQIICDASAHVFNFENGGIAFNSRCSVKSIKGNRGRFTSDDVEEHFQVKMPYYMQETGLVCIENTTNLGGGAIWDLSEIHKISKLCRENKIPLHLDGARLFNALVETNKNTLDFGKLFDTISICFSKGLGAPAGSILIGNEEIIKSALKIRKLLGGGMRQIGYLAAACEFAVDNNVNRLKEDHKRAKIIENELIKKSFISKTLPVQTNIVIFEIDEKAINKNTLMEEFLKGNIYITSMGKNILRITTHLDFSDDDLEKVIRFIKKL